MYLRHYALSRTAIATGSGSLRAHTQCTRLSCFLHQRTAHHLKRDPYHNAATGPYVQHEHPICVAHAYLHPGRLRRRVGGHRHRARVSRRRRRATPSLAPFAVNAPRRVRAAGGRPVGANVLGNHWADSAETCTVARAAAARLLLERWPRPTVGWARKHSPPLKPSEVGNCFCTPLYCSRCVQVPCLK